jgi:UDP-3-O-[3-hydroxymyristoyl] glucosamine N-acyltransferase
MQYTLSALAEKTGAGLSGSGDIVVEKVSDITSGEQGSIVFVSNTKYTRHLKTTAASAVIITDKMLQVCDKPALVTDNPRAVFAKIALLLNPLPVVEPWISPHAVIADDAEVNTRLFANVTIGEGCTIGDNNILHSGAVIGADGFGFVWDQDSYIKVPQLGSVNIGNNVEIGANTAIDRGAIGDTIIEDGVKLDNLVQLGHNVHIGEHTTMSGQCGVAGSAKVGKKCILGGDVAISDNIEIADNVILTGRSSVSNSISESGMYSSAVTVVEARLWRRILGRIKQLDELAKRIKALESTNK